MRPDVWRTEKVVLRYRMPLRRYVSYRVFWDRLTAREAEAAFHQALQDQRGGEVDSDGEATVTVMGIPYEQTITTPGACRTARSESSAGGDPDDVGYATPAGKRRRHSAGSEDEGEGPRPSSGSAFVGPQAGRPKAKAGAEKSGGRKARASDDILANRAACAPEDEAGVAGSSRRQVEMLKARSELAKDSKALLDEVSSKSSPLSVLEKRVGGMQDDQLALLEMDPKATLEAFNKDVMEPLRALHTAMARLRLREVQEKRVPIVLANPCHTLPGG